MGKDTEKQTSDLQEVWWLVVKCTDRGSAP